VINFRYHLVSIAAVFLSLAVGVVLGAGVFSDTLADGLGDSDQEQVAAELRQQVEANESINTFQLNYAQAVGPTLLGSGLQGRSVVVFSLPGTDRDDVKGVADSIREAGGSITTQVRLTPKLVDPSGRQFAEGVAGQALDGVKGVERQPDGSSYELVGTAIARAFTHSGNGAAKVDGTARTIMAAFTESGLLSADKKPAKRAGLAVIVAGQDTSKVKEGQGELVAILANTVDSASGGVLIAGPPGSATGNGAIKAIRASEAAEQVSTVDVANVPAGQIVAALALQREAAGKAGHYGTSEAADGAMPSLKGSRG